MKMGFWTLDDNNQPVYTDDVLVWGRWFEEASKTRRRVVGYDKVGSVSVSTVFLGLDQNFGLTDETPILYETMVFNGPLDQEMDRYATWDEALAGHQAMVERVKALPLYEGKETDIQKEIEEGSTDA